MKYIYAGLSWAFGIIFLLMGLVSITETPLLNFCFIAIAAFLLPPVRNFIYKKTNIALSTKARAACIVGLLMAFGFLSSLNEHRKESALAAQQAEEQAQKSAELRQKNTDYFNANREQVISAVKDAAAKGDYDLVIAQAEKYQAAGDGELADVSAKAKAAILDKQKQEKIEALLAELETLEIKDYEKKAAIYTQLYAVNPENESHKTAAEFNEGKAKEEKEKAELAEARKKEIGQQFSAWDGSHRNLERLIKEHMNDPKSYEHASTRYWDLGEHLVVQTTYRGKNAFGGVVKNTVKAKVSLDGHVLEVIDQF